MRSSFLEFDLVLLDDLPGAAFGTNKNFCLFWYKYDCAKLPCISVLDLACVFGIIFIIDKPAEDLFLSRTTFVIGLQAPGLVSKSPILIASLFIASLSTYSTLVSVSSLVLYWYLSSWLLWKKLLRLNEWSLP